MRVVDHRAFFRDFLFVFNAQFLFVLFLFLEGSRGRGAKMVTFYMFSFNLSRRGLRGHIRSECRREEPAVCSGAVLRETRQKRGSIEMLHGLPVRTLPPHPLCSAASVSEKCEYCLGAPIFTAMNIHHRLLFKSFPCMGFCLGLSNSISSEPLVTQL